jgi:myosin heavy subunit
MILRTLASVAVIAGLAGALWSAPAQPVESVVLGSGAPAEAERESASGDRIERGIDEFMERARATIERLHAAGRHEEADELEEWGHARLMEVRELQTESRRLRELGQMDQARQAQREAREMMAELRRRLAPPRDERPEQAERRQHMNELREKIAELRADGRIEEARELQRKARELAAQWREENVQPPRRPRPDDELREMRMHLQNLHREMDELHAQGHHEEAEALARKAEEIEMEIHQREAGRGDMDPGLIELRAQLERLHREIQEMHERGQHEEAGELEQHAQAIMMELREREGDRPHPEAELEEMQRRIGHLFQAAENLDAAGMPDQAEQLRRHAEMMEQKLHEHMERDRPRPEEHLQMLVEEMHELRAEVHELIDLVRDLHGRLDRLEDRD